MRIWEMTLSDKQFMCDAFFKFGKVKLSSKSIFVPFVKKTQFFVQFVKKNSVFS